MIVPAVRVKLTGVTYVSHRDDLLLLLAEQGQHPASCHGQAHAKGANFLRAPPPSSYAYQTSIKGVIRHSNQAEGQRLAHLPAQNPMVLSLSLLLLAFMARSPYSCSQRKMQ